MEIISKLTDNYTEKKISIEIHLKNNLKLIKKNLINKQIIQLI